MRCLISRGCGRRGGCVSGGRRMRAGIRRKRLNRRNRLMHRRGHGFVGARNQRLKVVFLYQVSDVYCNIASGLITLVGIFRQTLLYYSLKLDRSIGIEILHGRQRRVNDFVKRIDHRVARERPLSRRGFIQNASERKNIGAMVDRFALNLLRRHIADRSHDDAGLCSLHHPGLDFLGIGCGSFIRCLNQLGQPEVEYLRVPVLADHYVVGLQIPVNDPGRMRLGEPVGRLRQILEQLFQLQLFFVNLVPERLSVYELHRDVMQRSGVVIGWFFADFIDSDDVRMV